MIREGGSNEAITAVRADPDQFDLVVTDYNMPGASGLEVAHALKEIGADMPVVLASGYITEELRAEAPTAGVSELIYKPNTADDLCDALARYPMCRAGTKVLPDPAHLRWRRSPEKRSGS